MSCEMMKLFVVVLFLMVLTETIEVKPSSNAVIICPDTSLCPSTSTCCISTDGDYSCCPLQTGVCCSDHIHCCPEHYKCDLKIFKCDRVFSSKMVGLKPSLNKN